jgi:hypothetical protein
MGQSVGWAMKVESRREHSSSNQSASNETEKTLRRHISIDPCHRPSYYKFHTIAKYSVI